MKQFRYLRPRRRYDEIHKSDRSPEEEAQALYPGSVILLFGLIYVLFLFSGVSKIQTQKPSINDFEGGPRGGAARSRSRSPVPGVSLQI